MKRILVILVMFVAMNASAQWVQTSFSSFDNVKDIEVSDTNIYVSYLQSGVFRSANNGMNVLPISNGLPGLLQTISLKLYGTNVYTGNIYDGIYKTSNNGSIWFSINNTNIDTLAVFDIEKYNQNLFIATSNGLYMSTNEGNNWINIKGNIPLSLFTKVFYFSNKLYAAASYNNGLYYSTDFGVNWIRCYNGFPYSCDVMDYAVLNNVLFVSTYQNGIYKSSDNGLTWINCTIGSYNYVNSLCSGGNMIFAGISSVGVFYSTNYGQNWNAVNNNGYTGYFDISNLKSNSQYLFAGTYSKGVWRRPLSEIIGIQNISTETPSKYSLSQNYPNPFNPTTNIKFSIVNSGDVKLVVYDIQGREVQTLVNESLKPGTYEAAFDGSALNSGVYFYKLITGTFTETKKMLLIK
jgi:photosystem II stability/assembly factor-like uncharacterized protein